MLCRNILCLGAALAVASVATALPFDRAENPVDWGCPNLLIGDQGELVVMPVAIAELPRVPWAKHFGTTVHINLPVKGKVDVSRDGVPFHLDTVDCYRAGKWDPDNRLQQRLVELRTLALQRKKHLWQMVVVSASPPRLYFLDRLDFNGDDFHEAAENLLAQAFSPDGLIAADQTFAMFVLSADNEDAIPPTLGELGFLRGLYQIARHRVALDNPDIEQPTNLVVLLKATSTPSVPNMYFRYDPGVDFTRQWEDGP